MWLCASCNHIRPILILQDDLCSAKSSVFCVLYYRPLPKLLQEKQLFPHICSHAVELPPLWLHWTIRQVADTSKHSWWVLANLLEGTHLLTNSGLDRGSLRVLLDKCGVALLYLSSRTKQLLVNNDFLVITLLLDLRSLECVPSSLNSHISSLL